LVLAGRGAVIAGAREALVELADLIGAPVATTIGAKDFFRGHPFDLGICGTLSTEVTTEAIGTADCVIAFGAGLNQYTSAQGSLFAGKRIVHCDVNASRMGAFTRVDAAVIGDAKLSAQAMISGLHESGLELGTSAFRSASLSNALAKASPLDEFVDRSTADTVDLRTAMVRLDELLPDRRTLVTDTGRYMLAPWKFLHVDDPRYFVSTVAFGSIGLGIGSAIGAALARPDELTVLVAGDGGFMQHVGDLSTVARNGLRMLVVVADDHAYGAEYRKLKEYGVDPAFSFNEWPDFASVARAMGGDGMTVTKLAELDDVARRLNETSGLLLVDLKLDPSVEPGS
jgi:thiamine pyrophosphate-dependent acetolactate synthase large subunit-like protein